MLLIEDNMSDSYVSIKSIKTNLTHIIHRFQAHYMKADLIMKCSDPKNNHYSS